MINIVTFCFSLLRFLIFCSTYNCLLSAVWALIKFMAYKYEVYNVMPYPYFVYLAGSRYWQRIWEVGETTQKATGMKSPILADC